VFRKIAVTFVLFIGFFYTMPQMKGAGVAMTSIMGTPYWVGVVLVGIVISFNVALGGMKGITFVQAFQYWLKMFAISVPVFVLMAVFGGYHQTVGQLQSNPSGYPTYRQDAVRSFDPAKPNQGALSLPSTTPTRIQFVSEATLKSLGTARKAKDGEDKIPATRFVAPLTNRTIERDGKAENQIYWQAGETAEFKPVPVTKGGVPVEKDGHPVLTGAKLEFEAPVKVRFLAGTTAAGTVSNAEWIRPFGGFTNKQGYPLLYTFSLIVGLIFGTAGLPHILVRFYTNPDGRAAKRTTLWVMVLIGVFYLFPAMWGSMGRQLMPELYANSRTDAVVVELPRALGNVWGEILSGITAAGAFAAFMSTFSGLLVSMSSAVAHDIYGSILRPKSTPTERLKAFKIAAVVVGAVATLLGLMAESWDIALLVGWAFAIAACSYFPLLLLGAWWRGLTAKGAATGMLIGGLTSLGAIITTMMIDKKALNWTPDPIVRTLMEQPAIWGVPLALFLMWAVSSATRAEIPKDVDTLMLRLHAPEELGMSKDYIPDGH
jgi:Na+(H+)/acetate symporter ActP